MKRKITTWKKIKLGISFVFGYKTGTYTVCQFCNSPRVSFKTIKDEGRFFTAKYTCHNCGAIGYIAERWKMKEVAEK